MSPPPPAPSHPRAVALLLLALLALATVAAVPSSARAAPVGALAPAGTLAAADALAAPAALVDPLWFWPVDEPHRIVRPFIAPATAYASGHRGVDIAGTEGAVVRAPAAGIVHFSGFVVNRYVVSIDHGGGVLSSFEPVLSDLAEGALVRRGEPIGALQSGHCGAPCLHFGVRVDGLYVSPLNFLGGIPHSVLLPTRSLP